METLIKTDIALFQLPLNIRTTGIEESFITVGPISVQRCRGNSRRMREEPACDRCMHFEVTGEMMPEKEPFQVLQHMVVARRKVRTVDGMEKYLPAEPLQQLLCAQRRMRASVVVRQHDASYEFCSDYHLFQHLKRVLVGQHSQ
ncbi:hypothetical protein AVEN_257593-1 [Araneus ventricosus]|uniref:Uncharacterized protein n=1 Tax=Araneus ventricosus TaxID=182803 RepID=A0A4Y2KNT4_ARAVE|nr:hypothetical protein AVEN_257593-1 [Araneus ventricosus]